MVDTSFPCQKVKWNHYPRLLKSTKATKRIRPVGQPLKFWNQKEKWIGNWTEHASGNEFYGERRIQCDSIRLNKVFVISACMKKVLLFFLFFKRLALPGGFKNRMGNRLEV